MDQNEDRVIFHCDCNSFFASVETLDHPEWANVPMAVTGDPEVQKMLCEIRKEIGSDGRILLRESGTEPVIRVMVEYEGEAKCRHFVDRMIKVIKERGLACE